MKTLYIDCAMGAAGDMLTAALLALLPDPETFVARLNALGLPGVVFRRETVTRGGIAGSHVRVTVHGAEEGEHHHHDHDHEHEHHHHHHHSHSGLTEIGALIAALPVSDKVRGDVAAVYERIARAESAVHGVPVDQVHFHELGALDAVADVTAVCLLMEQLAPARVVISPVHVGSGQLHCAHGILPVPAPATAELLRGVPVYGGSIRGELCTPTGAALLKYFADEFGALPPMRTEAVGYGMGTKEFQEAPNCLRAMLGRTEEDSGETVTELACNLDDMSAEAIGFAMERLLEAGALDVYTLPIGMKKNRPGTMLCALCRETEREAVVQALFRHTTTLGVRETPHRRYTLARREETVETPFGPVGKKISAGWGISREKYEYEDLARIARAQDISLAEAAAIAAEHDK